MKSIGTADLKAHLSEHLQSVRRGDTITVLDRRVPIARIVPIGAAGLELVVRPAIGGLHDLPPLGPCPTVGQAPLDIVDDLLTERADRL